MSEDLVSRLSLAGQGDVVLDKAVLEALGGPDHLRPTQSFMDALELCAQKFPGRQRLWRDDVLRSNFFNLMDRNVGYYDEYIDGVTVFPSYARTAALAVCLSMIAAESARAMIAAESARGKLS